MSKGRALGLSTTYGRKGVNVAPTGTFLPGGQQTDELACRRPVTGTCARAADGPSLAGSSRSEGRARLRERRFISCSDTR